jgi:hypothetical protein
MNPLTGVIEVYALYPVDSRDESAAAGAAVDIAELQGDMRVVLDAEAGTGTAPTLDLALQHRADSADSWADIPAAALYDPETGQAATFDQVTGAAASTQVLALRREQLKAQLRAVLTIGGTTPDFVCAAYLIALPKYAGGW